jgi:small subunit ribosomal protein S18
MSDTINTENTEGQSPEAPAETTEAAQAAPIPVEKTAEAAAPAPTARPDRPERPHDRPRGRGGYYSDRGEGGQSEGGPRMPKFKKKICIFCQDKNMNADYRRPDVLERFITDRGKILPRRVTGTCAKHQRLVARAIKRARTIALLPFVEQ